MWTVRPLERSLGAIVIVWGDFVRLGECGAIGDANNGDEDDMVLSWNGLASSGRQNAGAGCNKEGG